MRKEMSMGAMLPLINETIESGGVFTLYPKGASMRPLLRNGMDGVHLCDPEGAGIGDIVLFRRESGEFVIHRIVAEKADGFVFCGDNQCVLEGGIKREQFVAKVCAILRDGRITPIDDPEYVRYVSSLPKRRRAIKRRAIIGAIKKKILGK